MGLACERRHVGNTNRGDEPATIDEVNVMSAKNANNNAENAKNGKAAKSMTEHYTLGHKAVAVAMSTVMLGFGVPVNAPKDAYADTDAAAEQPSDQDSATSAKKSTEDTSAKKTESTKATDSSSASSSSSTATQNNSSKADSSSAKDAAKTDTKAETKTTADVKLSLGNASIKYQGQTIAAPTTKVTVPTKNAFKFTVAADNGYTLTKVTVKVSGKESTLTADGNGIYTVAAADVATGASIKLVTEKQVQAQPAADTTPIENTESQAPAASQPTADQTASGDSSADAGQSASGDADNQVSAGEGAGESDDQQGSEEADGNEASQDESADGNEASQDESADGQSEETSESDAAQLQALGNEFLSMLSDSNSAISGPTSVAQADTITLTYNGEGTPQFWNGGDGLFSTWQESADHKTLTLTATSNWAFNGSSKNATIYCAYIDNEGV